MKKLSLLLALLLLVMTPALASSPVTESCTVNLDGADITFTPPENMLCLTMETSASVFNKWGLSQREMFAYMEAYGVIAVIYDLESDAVFEICAYPWDTIDYDDADDVTARLICAEILKDTRESGYEVASCDFYRNTGHAFVLLDTTYTYEDGYVEPALTFITCQNGYEVDIYAYPPEGEGTAAVKETAKQLADTVTIVPRLPEVTTEELPSGDFVLALENKRFTFTPIDIRFCVTRQSGSYAFNRMGYQRDAQLEIMEQRDIYAMLYDPNQRACVQVHIYQEMDAQDYAEVTDWLLAAAEKSRYVNLGWTVEEIELLSGCELDFVKAIVSCVREDGTVDRRMVYGTSFRDVRMEIQVFAAGEKILEMVEAQTDEFVRSITCELIEE